MEGLVVRGSDGLARCGWAYESELMVAYHDQEWGVPINTDRELFERLLLEGFQAGLSWRTILHKRENFRRAFDGFDPACIARYDEAKIHLLLQDAGIVRNRLKVRGAVQNAQAYLRLVAEAGSFSDWIWGFGQPPPRSPGRVANLYDLPGESEASRAMSRALRLAGFTFVGPTICYAFMQSAGLVDDHLVGCYRHGGAVPLPVA